MLGNISFRAMRSPRPGRARRRRVVRAVRLGNLLWGAVIALLLAPVIVAVIAV